MEPGSGSDRSAVTERRHLTTSGEVVDAWQLDSWDAYRTVPRLGRKTRLGEAQRRQLWTIFEQVRRTLDERGLVTMPTVFGRVTEAIVNASATDRPYDHAVVDEAQDIGVAQLRFLAALAGDTPRPDTLFFAGDLGQRIFQTPFSWKSLGVDVRGRSQTLRINYRTSHEIRAQADRLLPLEIGDVDGNRESRRGTVSAFTGPPPDVRILPTEADEREAIATWIRDRVDEGIPPHAIGIFVRSADQLSRAQDAVRGANFTPLVFDGREEQFGTAKPDTIAVGTMHAAKGLEFRAVVVAACDDEVIPLQERIESISDEADLEDVYDTERRLLYVACTRARERLLVTAVEPGSEFVEDLRGG